MEKKLTQELEDSIVINLKQSKHYTVKQRITLSSKNMNLFIKSSTISYYFIYDVFVCFN